MKKIADLDYRDPRLIIIGLILVLINGFFLLREVSSISKFDDRNLKHITVEQALKDFDHEQQVVLTDAAVDCSTFVFTRQRSALMQSAVAITDLQGKNLIVGLYNFVWSCESIANKPVSGNLKKLPSYYNTNPVKSRIIQNSTISPDNIPGIYTYIDKSNSIGLIIIESLGFLIGLWVFLKIYQYSRMNK